MIKIIALCGRAGAETQRAFDFILKHASNAYALPVHKVAAADMDINEYFDLLCKGETIENHFDENTTPCCTMRKDLKEDKINIGIFPIGGIQCLIDEPDLAVECIEVQTPDYCRLINLIDKNNNITKACQEYLKDQKNYKYEIADLSGNNLLIYNSTESLDNWFFNPENTELVKND